VGPDRMGHTSVSVNYSTSRTHCIIALDHVAQILTGISKMLEYDYNMVKIKGDSV